MPKILPERTTYITVTVFQYSIGDAATKMAKRHCSGS